MSKPKAMKIPATFELAGRTWKVKRGVKTKKWYGRCHHSKCLIELSAYNRNPEEEAHSFLHELLHAVAVTMGWKSFNKNEAKIDAVAGLLLQAFTTQRKARKGD